MSAEHRSKFAAILEWDETYQIADGSGTENLLQEEKIRVLV